VCRARLRADVEALCGWPRGSASPGERRAAEWVAAQLREAAATDVAVEPFRGAPTYGWAFATYAAAGLLAATEPRVGAARRRVVARLARAALALQAFVAFALDGSGRSQPLRRVLPAGEGTNVVARIPARGERRAVAILVAHLDAARTGLIWRLGLTKLVTRPGRMPPDAAPAALALLGAAAGAILPGRAGRALRAAARPVLAATVAANVDIATSSTVPGANDNASGVAGVLALVRALAAAPLPGVEVRVACVGCEESGMDGMRAYLRAHGTDLDPAATLVLGLDTIGSGTPIAAAAEGVVLSLRYGDGELDLADAGAMRAGLEPPRRWRIGGWTDPIIARFAGVPAVSLLSVDARGAYTGYHRPTDTPDRVDYDCVERCVRIARGALVELAARHATREDAAYLPANSG
jgi:Peptidase family M28